MSLAYIKGVRQQVLDAVAECRQLEAMRNVHLFTPVFWTGSHLHPVMIKLFTRKGGSK